MFNMYTYIWVYIWNKIPDIYIYITYMHMYMNAIFRCIIHTYIRYIYIYTLYIHTYKIIRLFCRM